MRAFYSAFDRNLDSFEILFDSALPTQKRYFVQGADGIVVGFRFAEVLGQRGLRSAATITPDLDSEACLYRRCRPAV